MEEKNDIDTLEGNQPVEATPPETVAVPAGANTRLVAGLHATDDVQAIEAPVTWQAYLICAFASFGGIFFGYDSGYINGVTGAKVFVQLIDGPLNPDGTARTALTSSHNSLVVSILSAGTFFGALIGGDVADRIGRKWTVIIGCGIYMFG